MAETGWVWTVGGPDSTNVFIATFFCAVVAVAATRWLDRASSGLTLLSTCVIDDDVRVIFVGFLFKSVIFSFNNERKVYVLEY